MAEKIHNDEATNIDKLNRDQFASALARISETCDTPLVIGLYGTWGIGKTSLMKLVQKKLDSKKTRSVWFDAWQHQFDENPALALLHTIVDQLEMKKEGKDLLMKVAGAFSSMLLKATTNMTIEDIDNLAKRYEEERFLVGEARVRLQSHIKEIIEKAQGKTKCRIVFFIDDLDRCMPSKLLNLLEALKLYLNLPECVYLLGADRTALENSIKHHYKDIELSEVNYLDKIVQLPFTIPPIAPESIEEFVKQFLSKDLEPCLSLLVEGLGDNPRQVKRFINTLTLNHQLALGISIPNYASEILAILLLIQLRSPDLYNLIANRNDMLFKLKEGEEEIKSIQEEYLEKDIRLKEAINKANIPEETQLEMYIYLTQLARVSEEPRYDEKKEDIHSIIEGHKKWIETSGKDGKRADLEGADLEGADLGEVLLTAANLREANLKGADLREAILRGADLRGARLTVTNLYRADLEGANLQGAFLRGADLEGADLGEANLVGANLNGTDLWEANLERADLREAILRRAKGLSIGQLSQARTLYNAILDPEMEKQIKEKYPHLLEKPKEKE